MEILITWIGFAVLGVGLFSALFLWAIRERQFTDQDRARYLPLQQPGVEADRDNPSVKH